MSVYLSKDDYKEWHTMVMQMQQNTLQALATLKEAMELGLSTEQFDHYFSIIEKEVEKMQKMIDNPPRIAEPFGGNKKRVKRHRFDDLVNVTDGSTITGECRIQNIVYRNRK